MEQPLWTSVFWTFVPMLMTAIVPFAAFLLGVAVPVLVASVFRAVSHFMASLWIIFAYEQGMSWTINSLPRVTLETASYAAVFVSSWLGPLLGVLALEGVVAVNAVVVPYLAPVSILSVYNEAVAEVSGRRDE